MKDERWKMGIEDGGVRQKIGRGERGMQGGKRREGKEEEGRKGRKKGRRKGRRKKREERREEGKKGRRKV